MARHLNLLGSARPTGAPITGLPLASVPIALALVGLIAGALELTSRARVHDLQSQIARLERLLAPKSVSAAPKLDANVIGALRQKTREREALAAALAGEAATGPAPASASQWLAALAEAGRPGVALNQVRIEPGARLTVAGSALGSEDVNGFVARLQQHPLAGAAAIGQLEMRRGEAGGDALGFRLTPPPPASWSQPAGATAGTGPGASPSVAVLPSAETPGARR